MATRAPTVASSRWLESLRKWYYSAAGFNKLGEPGEGLDQRFSICSFGNQTGSPETIGKHIFPMVLGTETPPLQPSPGLMRDDTLYEDEDVKEAIRRLPENLYNDRMFRIKRALDLTMRHQILPKNQWTKYEEDKLYLQPYLKEVIRERKEREEWNKK